LRRGQQRRGLFLLAYLTKFLAKLLNEKSGDEFPGLRALCLDCKILSGDVSRIA
jgi:hypothetical protein